MKIIERKYFHDGEKHNLTWNFPKTNSPRKIVYWAKIEIYKNLILEIYLCI